MFYLIAIRLHESDTWLSQLSSNSSSCPAVETSSTNQYVAAIYWAITTVTSVGYGDLHPENDIERVFGIIFIALGAGLLSYITGLMTILFGQEIENNSEVHLAGDDHQTVIINVKGHLVGEIGVLYCKRHPFKVQAKTSCQLLRLNRESLVKIAKFNGGDIYIILDRLIKHIGNNRNIGSAMKRVVQDPSFALTHDLVPFPLSLYDLVLAKGDHALPRLRNGREPTLDDETEDDRLIPNYLIGLMIKWGWNIDDIDHKGRNALHAASLRGSERWVRYLLACGMDPNQKDYDGGQPLFLAVSKGHDAVQDILVGAGAVCTVTPNEPSCDMGLLMAFKKKEEELEEKIRELEEEKATLQTLIDTLNDLRSNQSTWNDDF
ncbi:hypothetical protein RIF29_13864 [Crotalaria pallida]|uniref:Cyclic nucleotide-binding domain-containing protein n=1 Tax=Crotalaria pallida TaxID=3830 RepID=A0AAN9FCB2_CROPI